MNNMQDYGKHISTPYLSTYDYPQSVSQRPMWISTRQITCHSAVGSDGVMDNIEDSGGCIGALYLDVAEAFDTVPHQPLIKKLTAYGVHGEVPRWI